MKLTKCWYSSCGYVKALAAQGKTGHVYLKVQYVGIMVETFEPLNEFERMTSMFCVSKHI